MVTDGGIDLHMHSTVSDGSDAPDELIGKVREAGIALFSLTDHDAVKGCRLVLSSLRPGDPAFITGVEFSCRDAEGRYHILGYGYEPDSESVGRLVDKGHGLRMKKLAGRLDFLRREFGFEFPESEIDALYSLDNPGKPHIGNLMVKYGFAASMNEAIEKYLNRSRLRTEYITPEEAVSGILAGGGVPVLAHPFFGSGDQMIVGEMMEERLRRLIGLGLRGVEAFYSGFSPALTREMLALAGKYSLFVTAGSDYHGKNKPVLLGAGGFAAGSAMPDGMRRFLGSVRITRP